MRTSVSIRSVRLLLVLCFALASLYFISRSYARIPIPPTANSFTPGGKEPAKAASQFPITSPTEHHHVAGDPQIGKVKAAFVTLVRNNELWEIVKSIRQVEDRFNRNYHYPWIFLNDEPFTKEFKDVTTKLTSGMAKYALVPEEHWSIPSWIDEDKAKKAREDMAARNIIYGGSLPYRHMCRFQSGFFFRQPILDEYDWYWRVEPGTNYYCDIEYDVFEFMELNNYKYGFTMSLHEYVDTVPTLWDETKKFLKQSPHYLASGNALEFLSENKGDTYNMCHFWSNFEIASLNLWRNESYLAYFDHLDHAGGFFYERWGDAPVHSIAASLFLPKKQIHFFNDIGYFHIPFHHCPTEETLRAKCHCNPDDNFDWKAFSCTSRWYEINNLNKPKGWESQQ